MIKGMWNHLLVWSGVGGIFSSLLSVHEGFGHGVYLVGIPILCLVVQAGRLYATILAGSTGCVCGWWSMTVAWSQSMAWFVVSACSAAADLRQFPLCSYKYFQLHEFDSCRPTFLCPMQ